MEDGEPYLGCVDKIGTAYRDSKIATGYGAYLALPLMRDALEKKPQMTKEEVRALMIQCLQVLYYRDTRAFNKVMNNSWCIHKIEQRNVIYFFLFSFPFTNQVQIATITAEGVTMEGPIELETNWSSATLIQGYE